MFPTGALGSGQASGVCGPQLVPAPLPRARFTLDDEELQTAVFQGARIANKQLSGFVSQNQGVGSDPEPGGDGAPVEEAERVIVHY